MNKVILLVPVALLAACSPQQPMENETKPLEYPDTRKMQTVDTYFGTEVADPYRWLEDDNAPETEAWVIAQNAVTETFLSQIPFRDAIKERLTGLFNYTRVSAPSRVGEYYFFSKNDGLQNQAVIYYQKGRDGKPMVFIDPNTLSGGGTVAVNLLGASKDDKYIAYSQSVAGSDWSEIKVREVATNSELGDKLEWVKFSGASWHGEGFYYSRYPAPEKGKELSGDNKDHSIYYHKLGTSQSEDKLFYRNEQNPNLYHYANISEDEHYLFMYASSGTDGFETYYKNLKTNGPLVKVCTGFANKTSIIDHVNGKFLATTDIASPNYKLVAIDPTKYQQEHWEVVIPETKETLTGVSTGGGYLFAEYLKDATSVVYRADVDGKNLQEISFPVPGTASGFSGKKEDKTVFYTFTSFTYPSTIFEYDVATGESVVFNKPDLQFNPEDYEANQVWIESKDGTKVPMFVVHKKDLKINGLNPTILYGYGGFNISLTPSFSMAYIAWLELGGVYAVVNLRGGGEYGEEWHQKGMKLQKQNVFDDFIGAAEYLINNRYTSASKLAIRGGSNGGLLVGAAMAQRPELFAVALPAVGVLDMLRFHKFTVGKGWIPEYGCADSTKAEFDALYAYSPLHNLKDGVSYPATLITTGDHDDRVVPAHSFKFAARLQEAHAGKTPVLIRIDTNAGHGAGKPMSKIIDEQADIMAFTLYTMGIRSLQPDQQE